jgi:hypothetical protein
VRTEAFLSGEAPESDPKLTLITDLEDAPYATADRDRPPVVTTSLPVRRDDGAAREIPPLGQVIIEEGLQRHGIDVGTVFVPGIGPKVIDQEASVTCRGLSSKKTTNVGPADHFPVPSSASVAVGNWKTGQGPKPCLDLELTVLASSAKRRIPG